MFKLKHIRKLEEIIRELPENIRGPTYEAFIFFKEDVLLKETREIKDQISRVWEVLKELTEAQRRTAQGIEKIWNALKELTEAQKRTEEAQRRIKEEPALFRKTTEEKFNKVWTAKENLQMFKKELNKGLKNSHKIKKKLNRIWIQISIWCCICNSELRIHNRTFPVCCPVRRRLCSFERVCRKI